MRTTGFNKKQGFTLIEIIIVVVILGILAAVALPKITQNIGKAAVAEVFNVGGETAKAFNRCLEEQSAGVTVTNAMVRACSTYGSMNMTVPPVNNFTYVLTTGSTFVTMLATAVAQNGFTSADTVRFIFNGAAGTNTKGCSAGTLFNMCK